MRGILTEVEKDQAFLEINGITYGIFITSAVSQRLIASGKTGQEVTFHTLEYIEGNPGMGNLIPRLVGFPNKTDVEFFSLLITVQGLGAKKTLRALTVPVKELARAIELNDVATLKSLPEIGSVWTSRTSAIFVSPFPSNCKSTIMYIVSAVRAALTKSSAGIIIDTGSIPAPYKTAGTLPSRRYRLAAPLPCSSRVYAVKLTVFILHL